MGYINRNLEDSYYAKKIELTLTTLENLWTQDAQNIISMELRHPKNKILHRMPTFEKYDYHTDIDKKLVADDGVIDIFSFSLIGHPGMGKSRIVDKVTRLQPRFIYHSKLDGSIQSAFQIPCIKLDVPHNGLMKGLCENFINSVSNITKIDFFYHYQINDRTNTVRLMSAVAALCASYSIGAIILDEIQYLLHAQGQKQTWVINFLNDLSNKLSIPIIIVGTYETYKLLDKFHLARRNLGQPEPMWNPLPYCSLAEEHPMDDSWRRFIKGLWKYQYVLNSTLSISSGVAHRIHQTIENRGRN